MRRAGARTRLALLALAVLGAHGWLVSGLHTARPAQARSAAWVARTVEAALPAAHAIPGPMPTAAAAAAAAAAQPPLPQAAAAQPRAARRPPGVRTGDGQADAHPAQGAGVAAAAGEALQVAAAGPEAHAAPARTPAANRPGHYKVHPSATFHYKVIASAKGFELQGEGELEWRREGDSYEARLTARSPLVRNREQRSSGLVTDLGVTPLRFSDRGRSEEAVHFQREAGRISFSNNQPDAPLEPGAQDRLSVILQLGAILAGEPRRHPPGSTITVQTASVRSAEPWVFTVEGEDALRLPGGEVSALRLVRNPRQPHDTKVELWLAPGMDYAPVRLRLTQPNGDWVDQQWSGTDRG